MRVAVVESGDLPGELLTFAARRQRHSVVSLRTVDDLRGSLPFVPAAIALVGATGRPATPTDVAAARAALPQAAVVVVAEGLRPGHRADLLRAGAHDVVDSPFDPLELLLKLTAWTRQPAGDEPSELCAELADLLVDAERYRVRKNGRDVTMTPLEVRILYCLAAHSPNLTPAERILSFGWGALEDPDTSLIRTHICHLRRKLEKAGGVRMQIRSKHTLGYTLIVEGQ